MFIVACSEGGIIFHAKPWDTIEEAREDMESLCKDHFDPESDDCRIFDENSNEIESYDSDSTKSIKEENL
jgi:hypothetical protein